MFYKKSKYSFWIRLITTLYIFLQLLYFWIVFNQSTQEIDELLREDYIFEWGTFFALFLLSFLFILYARVFWKHKMYRNIFIFVSVIFFLGSMEEVSWFQRVFDFTGPELIRNNNSQGEFNLHNIMIGDFSINRNIFGKILGLLIGIFYLVPSLVKELSEGGALFFKAIYFPTPELFDALTAITIVACVYLFLDFKKQGEILEYLLSIQMFFMYLRYYISIRKI